MRDIIDIVTEGLRERSEDDPAEIALALINKGAQKFGRSRLAAGNCGTFALALAWSLREKGFRPSLGFLYRFEEGNIDDLASSEPDIYHVVMMLGDRMFDAAGEIDVNDLLALSMREYRDPEPGFLQHVGMDEPAALSLIENDTNWSINTGTLRAALKSTS